MGSNSSSTNAPSSSDFSRYTHEIQDYLVENEFVEFVTDFMIGAIASGASMIFSNPLDMLKGRMQLRRELKSPPKKKDPDMTVLKQLYLIATNEGVVKLQTGLASTIYFHMFKCGVRLGGYEWFYHKGWLTNEHGNIKWKESVLAGGIFGGIGAFFVSPIMLIKTKQHMEKGRGCKTTFMHMFKTIYSHVGLKGLWRGSPGLVLETTLGSAVQLTVFEVTQEQLELKYPMMEDNKLISAFFSSIVSSFLQVLLTHPFETVTTRLFNQGYDKNGNGLLYSNFKDCISKVYNTEGIDGFYKGLKPNLYRNMPQIFLTLMFWDYMIEAKRHYQQMYIAFREELKKKTKRKNFIIV